MATHAELGRITTDIPARWTGCPGSGGTGDRDRPGNRVDPGRPRGDLVGSLSDVLKDEQNGLGLSSSQIGLAGAIYVAGVLSGRPVLRAAHGPVRSQEAVHAHAGHLPTGTVLTAFSMNPIWSSPAGSSRRGPRWRYRRQLGDRRRADPHAVPRPGRHRHQRLVLGRRSGRSHDHRAADERHGRRRIPVARRLRVGAGLALVVLLVRRNVPETRAGCSSRPGGGEREDRPRDRGDGEAGEL